MRWFAGKNVLITGGSSGIGRSAAVRLAAYGANIAIIARNAERLDETLAELEPLGDGTFVRFSVDISDREAVEALMPQIVEALGGLDVVINNAGVALPGYVAELDDDVFESMMDINYFGTVNVTRAALPTLIDQGSGHICNVSSVLGFMGVFGYTAYAASKFAITGFSECLRQELVTKGVQVSVVYPPDTDTPQLAYENQFKPPETKMLAGNVKMLTPEHVADDMLEGIARGRGHIVPGLSNKFVYFMNRHFPTVVRWFIDGDLKRFERRN